MNTNIAIVTAILALALSGCSNTAEGMKQDSAENSEKSSDSTNNLVKGAKEAGSDMGAATMLTPKIKSAINADKRLNDPKNLIDISSTSDKVTLDGHVTTEDLKALAGEITTKYLTANKATQTVENNLKIQP